MSKNKVAMPSSQGGIVRYFDDYKSKLHFSPAHIIFLALLIILIELFLHAKGMSLLGL